MTPFANHYSQSAAKLRGVLSCEQLYQLACGSPKACRDAQELSFDVSRSSAGRVAAYISTTPKAFLLAERQHVFTNWRCEG